MTVGPLRVESRVPTGSVESIRALRMVRTSATRDRTSAINQMRALIVTAPDDLREAFREVSIAKLVNSATRLRPTDATDRGRGSHEVRVTQTRPASPVAQRRDQTRQRCLRRTRHDHHTEPGRTSRRRIDTTATLLIATGDNPERLHSDALWRIVLVRMGKDPRTRLYVERRTAEGESKREIMRCLKRCVAREVYCDHNLIKEALDNQ